MPGPTQGITDVLRAVHCHDDRVVCLHVAKHLCCQNCVRHVLWGEQHWQHDGFAELSSVGPDLLAAVERALVEEEHVEAVCILRQRAKTSFAAIIVDDECRGQHLGGGRHEAQEVEQRPCEGAKSSEGMTFKPA